ncbi:MULTISPECIES: GntR family transcriptional regulator [unclassified Rhizobium]|uniref:GntR family transcriptional regulator n=1 Tax=unclassified Rhizobium TaxID=2613769 RepID=UPI001AD9E2F1|nr:MULTISPECIES: GntR family transcriptional regulator [unclassified Rhizobium]MBO9126598.1 GntR family transcriptional regulator [Rhizobium sp. 16-488-2b]MBO9177002.1 GntR family transcriptional regulator [Rhizobium sp. 16-488-2a]
MAETVAERIARAIGERIVSGELAAGTPLRQDHIAEEFDASHVPAREALQLLRAQGLAVSLPRRGMRVAPLDQASIQETVEIRAALEALALRHAAPRLNAAALERIELALAACDNAGTLAEWEGANRVFHRELVSGCRMPRLLAMLDDLQLANSRIIFSATRSAGWRPGSSMAHRQIVDALKKRDFQAASGLLDMHIRELERANMSRKS